MYRNAVGSYLIDTWDVFGNLPAGPNCKHRGMLDRQHRMGKSSFRKECRPALLVHFLFVLASLETFPRHRSPHGIMRGSCEGQDVE